VSSPAREAALSSARREEHRSENARRRGANPGRQQQARRFSAEGKAVARWEKLYVRNGIRSLRQFANESWDARAYLSRLLIEGETIPPALVEEQRRAARAAVLAHVCGFVRVCRAE